MRDKATDAADEVGNKTGSSIGKKLTSAVSAAAKVCAAAITAASAGIAALGKSSIAAYADYEQLVGGAELMFGDAYDYVAEKAANAYATVQMSQNDYLQQVNGLSTGLKTALNGDAQAAAELADRVVTAEADVIAATGAAQENVQNAFNGIMKSNYTMLDNLQLGITPTKEGFQELIDKVNEWNAANGNATDYTIDNLADAQSALVDYIEMQGLAGYAAGEAAETIQGSVAAMKGAWQNLLVGFASDNANIDQLINSFVDSAVAAGENLMPRIQSVLGGMSTLISSASTTLIPLAVSTLTDNAPALITAGADLIFALVDGLIDNIDVLANTAIDLVLRIVEAITDPERSEAMAEAAVVLVVALVAGLIKAVPRLVSAAGNLVLGLVTGITNQTDKLINKGMEIVQNIGAGIKEKLAEARQWGANLLEGIWNGISDKVAWLKQQVSGVVNAIKSWFTGKDGFDTHSPSKWSYNVAAYLMEGLALGMKDSKDEVMETVEDITDELKTRLSSITDVLSGHSDVLDMQYELWERTDGANASDLEKYAVKLTMLGQRQSDQAQIVDATAAAYDAIVAQYGAASEQSMEYQKQVLQEQLALQDLLDEIQEVTEARDKAIKEAKESPFGFSDSAVAKATAPVVNAVTQASAASSSDSTTSFTLMLPDGTKLASYLFQPLTQYASANGTPILNPTT